MASTPPSSAQIATARSNLISEVTETSVCLNSLIKGTKPRSLHCFSTSERTAGILVNGRYALSPSSYPYLHPSINPNLIYSDGSSPPDGDETQPQAEVTLHVQQMVVNVDTTKPRQVHVPLS